MSILPPATPIDRIAPLSSDKEVFDYVKSACEEVDDRRKKRKAEALETALREGRDAVLEEARLLDISRGTGKSKSAIDLVFPRIPSIECPSVSNAPGLSYSKPKTKSVAIRKREGGKNSWKLSQKIKPIEMEPIHDSLPPSTTTLFLKSHFAAGKT